MTPYDLMDDDDAASEELNQMDAAVVELLDVLDKRETAIIEHWVTWHMDIEDHTHLIEAVGKIKALLGMKDK